MKRRGLTLVELTVVLVVMAALAAFILPLLNDAPDDARTIVTRANLRQLRDIIRGAYRADMTGRLPVPSATWLAADPTRRATPQLAFLFWNADSTPAGPTLSSFTPAKAFGWRGPYVGNTVTDRTSASTFSIANLTTAPAQRKFASNSTSWSLRGKNDAADWLHDFGNEGDPTVLDGWLFPIVIQRRLLANGSLGPMSLQSAGLDNILDTADDLWVDLE